MRRLRRSLSLFLVVPLCMMLFSLSLFTMKPSEVFACSCAEPPTIADSLERKTAIFAGKVTDVEGPKPGLGGVWSGGDPMKVTLEVTEVWKGELGKETTISTAMSTESCGYDRFAVGSDYLVFAYGAAGNLKTGICEGTKLLSSAGSELKELGEGRPPADETDPDVRGDGSGDQAGLAEGESTAKDPVSAQQSPVIWGAVAVLALVLLIYGFWRMRNNRM